MFLYKISQAIKHHISNTHTYTGQIHRQSDTQLYNMDTFKLDVIKQHKYRQYQYHNHIITHTLLQWAKVISITHYTSIAFILFLLLLFIIWPARSRKWILLRCLSIANYINTLYIHHIPSISPVGSFSTDSHRLKCNKTNGQRIFFLCSE